MNEKKLIDLYPYRIFENITEFLVLKRASGKVYEGQWRMIGGKVKPGETYWQAALRELEEETNLKPMKFWTIPGVNQFYEHQTDTIHSIPAFAAQISPDDTIELDEEHNHYQWTDSENAAKLIQWPEQIRLIKLTNQLVNSNQILDDWLVTSS